VPLRTHSIRFTEISWSLGTRFGNIQTPWVSFNPELTSYGEKLIPNSRVKVSEQYAWAGIAFKLRAYNVFLEGQLKDSEVTYRGGGINRGIIVGWWVIPLLSPTSIVLVIR
jgi:hypothetical protein